MVRFSCFQAHIHSHKSKKTVHLSAEAMQKALEDSSENQCMKEFTNLAGTSPSHLQMQGDTPNTNVNPDTCVSSIERDWKSEEIKSNGSIESDIGIHKGGLIKKSMSLGSGLDWKGRASCGVNCEDEACQGFSCDGSHDGSGSVVPAGGNNPGINLPNQFQEAIPSDSLQMGSDMFNNESIFSIGDPPHSEKEGRENSDEQFLCGESSDHAPRTPPVIVKSRSVPNIGSYGEHSSYASFAPRSRSSEDLNVLDSRQKEMMAHEVGPQRIPDEDRDDYALDNEKNNCENPADDSCDNSNYEGLSKDWIVPVMDEANTVKNIQGEFSVCGRDGLPSKDFKIKRIEDWVMDLQHCSPLEEKNELSTSAVHQELRSDTVLDSLITARFNSKVNPGMEAAKNYLSSLTATTTTAQLANHGLVVIPFLSTFVSLRALNLSGNAIVRITAGALPRGLHVLNISKNNISTIEGLRELTRLRVLDLSYNRILRIGHGLASCSSLKELYLAGNKISEVEGLHRLLKLHVLDLRFNKISTAKCLGQLAANYNSLQAISLEGNPAQKNVGDEQLKKYLQGLLPHLAYFNRKSIKLGTLKDAPDRPARLGTTAHQIDRGLRSDLKTTRKGSHGLAGHKVASSSSIHGRRNHVVAAASSKPSSSRHVRQPPPSGTKTTTQRHHFNDLGSKLLSFKSDHSVRRSRSEGTLAAL
ncbi:unnamed protein product [Ilex paraguariensis]|uniref:Uncharacterized protein n=1 Tax=Ilex paraguariensis TaxID=185542 RepID=A0ABC8RMF4_9AQUA